MTQGFRVINTVNTSLCRQQITAITINHARTDRQDGRGIFGHVLVVPTVVMNGFVVVVVVVVVVPHGGQPLKQQQQTGIGGY